MPVGFGTCGMRGARSARGVCITTSNDRTPSLGYRTPAEFARVWENAASPSRKTDTVPPESSQRPSPAGAQGGLDCAPSYTVENSKVKAMPLPTLGVLYNYLDGKRGHVNVQCPARCSNYLGGVRGNIRLHFAQVGSSKLEGPIITGCTVTHGCTNPCVHWLAEEASCLAR